MAPSCFRPSAVPTLTWVGVVHTRYLGPSRQWRSAPRRIRPEPHGHIRGQTDRKTGPRCYPNTRPESVLSDSAVDEQLDPRYVSAVLRSEEYGGTTQIVGRAQPVQGNVCDDTRFVLICEKVGEAGCVCVARTQYIHPDPRTFQVQDPTARQGADRRFCRVVYRERRVPLIDAIEPVRITEASGDSSGSAF